MIHNAIHNFIAKESESYYLLFRFKWRIQKFVREGRRIYLINIFFVAHS